MFFNHKENQVALFTHFLTDLVLSRKGFSDGVKGRTYDKLYAAQNCIFLEEIQRLFGLTLICVLFCAFWHVRKLISVEERQVSKRSCKFFFQ